MEGRRVNKFFSTNLKLKSLAVIFSIALWFFVAGQSNTEVGFLVPIGYKGVPADLVIGSSPPDEVEVRVEGPKFFINNISPAKIIAEIDMSNATEGLNTFRFKPTDVTTPMGVQVVRLRPSSVEVRMYRLEHKTLKVVPLLKGRPQAGYEVAQVQVSPDTVDAASIKKSILKLRSVNTVPIDVTGINETMSATVQIDVPSRYEFRSISAEKADVKVIVRKAR